MKLVELTIQIYDVLCILYYILSIQLQIPSKQLYIDAAVPCRVSMVPAPASGGAWDHDSDNQYSDLFLEYLNQAQYSWFCFNIHLTF